MAYKERINSAHQALEPSIAAHAPRIEPVTCGTRDKVPLRPVQGLFLYRRDPHKPGLTTKRAIGFVGDSGYGRASRCLVGEIHLRQLEMCPAESWADFLSVPEGRHASRVAPLQEKRELAWGPTGAFVCLRWS